MEEFEAVVEETVFRNEENGYSVLQVRVGRTRTSAVGVLPALGAVKAPDHSLFSAEVSYNGQMALRYSSLAAAVAGSDAWLTTLG